MNCKRFLHKWEYVTLDSLTTKWAGGKRGKNFDGFNPKGNRGISEPEKSGKPENVVWPFMGHHIAAR